MFLCSDFVRVTIIIFTITITIGLYGQTENTGPGNERPSHISTPSIWFVIFWFCSFYPCGFVWPVRLYSFSSPAFLSRQFQRLRLHYTLHAVTPVLFESLCGSRLDYITTVINAIGLLAYNVKDAYCSSNYPSRSAWIGCSNPSICLSVYLFVRSITWTKDSKVFNLV